MKTLKQSILEKLILIKTGKKDKEITFFPKTKEELQRIIKQKYDEEGPNCDLSDIDTSQITDMSNLFKNLPDFNGYVDDWDVSNVKDFSCMFNGCNKLESLNLILWEVDKSKDFQKMFCGCRSLKSIGDVSRWNVSNSKFMTSMFENCSSLKLDISKWKFNEKCNTAYITRNASGVTLT
jgi:hypothetical protein